MNNQLEIQIVSDKKIYQLGNNIMLTVKISNRSKDEIFLDAPLKEGVNIIYEMYDEKGLLTYLSPAVKMELKQALEDIKVPINDNIVLEHQLVDEEKTPIRLSQGRYRLTVTYLHKNTTGKLASGRYKSKEISITVVN